MARKVNRNVIALTVAAMATACAAGSLHTATPSGGSNTIVSPAGITPTTGAALASLLADQPGTVRGLGDGQYLGTGVGRAGSIGVARRIEGGTIAGVRRTMSSMRNPTRLIARLPAEAIARQSTSVDLVAGATFSSRTFIAAVNDALAKASSLVPPANGGS